MEQKVNFLLKYPGRAAIAKQGAFERRELLETVFKRTFSVKAKPHELGEQYVSIEGLESDRYHFTVRRRGESSDGIPFVRKGWRRLYLDMKNIMLGDSSEGMEVVVTVVPNCSDFSNSILRRDDTHYEEFRLQELSELEHRIVDRLPRRIQVDYLLYRFMQQAKDYDGTGRRHRFWKLWVPQVAMNKKTNPLQDFPISDAASQLFRQEMPFCCPPAAPAVQEKAGHFPLSSLSARRHDVHGGGQDAETRHIFALSLSAAAPLGGKGGPAVAMQTSKSPEQSQPNCGQRIFPPSGRARRSPVPFSFPSGFRAIIFDLDGIIVDSEKAHLLTFNKVLQKRGLEIGEKMWRRSYTGIGSIKIMEDVFRRSGISGDIRPVVAERAKIYQTHVEKKGLPEIAGFKKFERFLSQNKVKFMVASGGHKPSIAASLRSIGLPKVKFVGLEDVRHGKPSPEIFLLAAKKLGVKPGECIVFEDSLSGMEAARQAGMPCIALSTTLPVQILRGRATAVFQDYNSPGLKALFAALIRGRKRKGVPLSKKKGKSKSSKNRQKKKKFRRPALLRVRRR